MALACLLAVGPGDARAQSFASGHLGALPEEPSASGSLSESEGAIAGPCGELIRQHAVIVSDEVDGRAFRGVGAPGRGTEVQLDVWGGAIPVSTRDGGGAGEASIRTVLLHLYRRACLTGQLRVPVPFGSLGPYTLGNPTAELGLLVRTPLDGFRFELGATVAFPSVGEHVENALALQTGYHAALLTGSHDELGWLPMLEWGGKLRGQLRVQTTPGPAMHHLGVMADLALHLGLARIGSALGPREGLVGGVRLALGLTWRPPMQTDSRGVPRTRRVMPANLGAAFEARLGFGSLWPTDVLLPVYLGARIDVGVASRELGHPEIALTFGWVFPQLVLDGESYFQAGVSVVVAVDASPGQRGTSLAAPRASPPDSAYESEWLASPAAEPSDEAAPEPPEEEAPPDAEPAGDPSAIEGGAAEEEEEEAIPAGEPSEP